MTKSATLADAKAAAREVHYRVKLMNDALEKCEVRIIQVTGSYIDFHYSGASIDDAIVNLERAFLAAKAIGIEWEIGVTGSVGKDLLRVTTHLKQSPILPIQRHAMRYSL